MLRLTKDAHEILARACSLSGHECFHLFRRTAPLGRAPLGRARGALRCPVPRRARRLHGRRRAPLHRRRPRSLDLLPAMGRVRLRARLRRPAAARRALRRPARAAPGVARRARGLHARVDPRRHDQRRHAVDRHPLPQGRRRRLHGSGEPFDHHHDVRGGSGPQPRAQHLHRLRGEWVLAGPRVRWPADGARLALDLPASRAGRAGRADRGSPRAGEGRADRRRACGAASTSRAR